MPRAALGRERNGARDSLRRAGLASMLAGDRPLPGRLARVKRFQIVILAVVVLVDLAFVLWHYAGSRPYVAPPAAPAPAVQFRAAMGPNPVAIPSASPAASGSGGVRMR